MAAIVLVLQSKPCSLTFYLLSADNDLIQTWPVGWLDLANPMELGLKHLGLKCDLDLNLGDLYATLLGRMKFKVWQKKQSIHSLNVFLTLLHPNPKAKYISLHHKKKKEKSTFLLLICYNNMRLSMNINTLLCTIKYKVNCFKQAICISIFYILNVLIFKYKVSLLIMKEM